ncbi:hypothetical protein MLD38_015286 [Melastoma candidum]|uniref:Uncharacterized protein n=1 Tax=Melastoma candidum TaxID=119954 RepID=A0ACB9RFG0_9MYRT|nr:hypothetical protein MLD38_015286 [Melastoma candidum]
MACLTATTATTLLRLPSAALTSPPSRPIVRLGPLTRSLDSLSLSSSRSISVFPSVASPPHQPLGAPLPHGGSHKFFVFAAKGYKMKTHKASAKRFRVTGTGKIVRRRAGKQHLLAKKNTKRKLRLSKMHAVSKSDYDNVIGAMPYLKVNRKAT